MPENINSKDFIILSSHPSEEDISTLSLRDKSEDNEQKIDSVLTEENVINWGFDLLATLTIPRSVYPIQVLFIRCGPYVGKCQVLSNESFKNFPLIDSTPQEHFKNAERLFINKRNLHPIWQNHPALWFARSTLWMLHVCRSITDDPHIPSPYSIAVNSISPGPSNDYERKALEAELRSHVHSMLDTIIGTVEPLNPSATRPTIHNPMAATQEEIANAVEDIDGVLWIDERAAEYLAKLPDGSAFAQDLREASRARVTAYRENPNIDNARDLFRFWLTRYIHEPVTLFIMRLAEVLWIGTVKPQLSTPNYKIKGTRVTPTEDIHVVTPRVSAGILWATKGSGNVINVIDSTPVIGSDGEHYQVIPRSVRFVSSGAGVLQTCQSRLRLPLPVELELTPAQRTSQFIIGSNALIFSPTTGKLLALLFIVTGPEMKRGTIESLTRELNPNTKRLQRRDYEETLRAIIDLKSLKMRLPDDTYVQVFDIRAAENVKDIYKEQPVIWGYGRNFIDAMPEISKGGFMINFSALMRLTAKENHLSRHYYQSADLWNNSHNRTTGRFDANLVRAYPTHEWAAATNNLSLGSIEYLLARQNGFLDHMEPNIKRKLSRQLSDDLNKTIKDLRDLERVNLVLLDVATTKEVRVLPTQAYLDAYELQRQLGTRPQR